jgi:hypothetical protein
MRRTSLFASLALAYWAAACGGPGPSLPGSASVDNGAGGGSESAGSGSSAAGGGGLSGSGAGSTGSGSYGATTAGSSGSAAAGMASPGVAGPAGGAAGTGMGTAVGGDAGVPNLPPTGVLTAGVWDDRLNYTFFTDYLATHTGIPGSPGFSTADYDASHVEFAQRSARSVVDAALVIDTTGSMGDELAYLTAEFAGITGALKTAFPNADQRWALVVYRDTPETDPGDDYIVRSYDFTGDVQSFANLVGQQTAANGGDYPESPELGLEALGQLSWRSDPSVAKVAFWVGDAPQHDTRGPAMKQAILDAHTAGIHVYPVSASGTNDLLELTMRSAAEITGGRYLFLTDDSGVGDSHKVPEIPCYYVTRLEKALTRVVSMELSGAYAGPDAGDVLRVSGDPSPDGTCDIADGGAVQIF